MPESVLILGGRGFVGSAITRAASEQGWTVKAVGREDYPEIVGTSWDVVINANGNSKKFLSDREPANEFDQSVRSVAHSLHDIQFGRYVFLSTVDVYPDKANPAHNAETTAIDPMKLSRYGFHKWQAEQLVRFNAPSWLILRMAGFVGPGLKKNPIYDLLTGAPLRVHPDSAYQYQHTATLAATVLDLLGQPAANRILNVAGDGVITLREVAAWIPGAALPPPSDGLTPEYYETNIDQLKAIRSVPTTKETVHAFVRAVQDGKEMVG